MNEQEQWVVTERPGYQGKRKDADISRWNLQYGVDNWRIAWEGCGEIWNFDDVFWKVYVSGYAKYIAKYPRESEELASRASYTYDKDLILRDQAFDPYFFYNKPGHPNQFHNVALNIAMEYFAGEPFLGNHPLQVRESKPGTPDNEQPAGWLWSPGKIPVVRRDLIVPNAPAGWWERGTIEEFYQAAKILQVKTDK